LLIEVRFRSGPRALVPCKRSFCACVAHQRQRRIRDIAALFNRAPQRSRNLSLKPSSRRRRARWTAACVTNIAKTAKAQHKRLSNRFRSDDLASPGSRLWGGRGACRLGGGGPCRGQSPACGGANLRINGDVDM